MRSVRSRSASLCLARGRLRKVVLRPRLEIFVRSRVSGDGGYQVDGKGLEHGVIVLQHIVVLLSFIGDSLIRRGQIVAGIRKGGKLLHLLPQPGQAVIGLRLRDGAIGRDDRRMIGGDFIAQGGEWGRRSFDRVRKDFGACGKRRIELGALLHDCSLTGSQVVADGSEFCAGGEGKHYGESGQNVLHGLAVSVYRKFQPARHREASPRGPRKSGAAPHRRRFVLLSLPCGTVFAMHRRTFLQSIPGAAMAASVHAESAATTSDLPMPDPPEVPIKLGFDTYSLRAFKWKAPQLVDYAAGLKLDTIQLSSLGDFESLDPGYLQKVKDQAARHNMTLDGGTGCICPSSKSFSKNGPDARERVLQGLRAAKAIGAKAMRCFMGSSADRLGPLPIEAHIENTVKVLKSVRQETLDLGVKIAIENHDGDMQARETKMLIEEAGPDFVGSNLDTGNPIWVVEDPMLTLETLAPYVVTSHIRDSVVFAHERGAAGQWVALGSGSIDFKKFTARFRELCPHAAMQLESITGRPPRILNYFEADFWKPLPKALSWEFARFTELVRNGHSYIGPMVIEDIPGTKPPDIMAQALQEQQRIDLERGLEYAKKSLNVGVNWRS